MDFLRRRRSAPPEGPSNPPRGLANLASPHFGLVVSGPDSCQRAQSYPSQQLKDKHEKESTKKGNTKRLCNETQWRINQMKPKKLFALPLLVLTVVAVFAAAYAEDSDKLGPYKLLTTID